MKILSLIIVVLLVLGIVGCTKGQTIDRHPDSDSGITTSLEIQVRQLYSKTVELVPVNQLWVDNYLGTFADASFVVVRSCDVSDAIWVEKVGGLVFTDNAWLPILVFYDGEFLSLTAALANGIIGIVVLQEVHARYNA